ncbi:MAG: catalase, partial [Chitinophagaceae bacterium]|nr:catalase [Rubrivivax sp.]
RFSFDVLDPTKIVPEELVPLQVVGTMTLNRNPDNFFAETEQVAYCTSHIVPGIDFSNDPLLQGRLFSYQDTQLTRLGGPNFHEIPINAPIAQVHNNQRDGMHRQALHRGRVSYEPNSLGGGCPHQAGMAGFRTVAEPVRDHKVRIKPEKFADHYSQATLFFASQTAVEQQHIINAFVFELTRVELPAIRQRMVSVLRNVDEGLAQAVAGGLGMDPVPDAQPLAVEPRVVSEVEASPSLSMFARPGQAGATGRRVALLAADGCDGDMLMAVRDALLAAGAAPKIVGTRMGVTTASDGTPIETDTSVTAMPSVLWDAAMLDASPQSLDALCAHGPLLEFMRDQFRHCKAIMLTGDGDAVLAAAGIPLSSEDHPDAPGIVWGDSADDVPAFVAAIARHRHLERESTPPPI